MLKRIFEILAKRRVPFAILVAGILAFGLQIPRLGFYQDDWHFIHYGSAAGARGMLEFLTMDGRPTAAWVYATLYPLLGFSPLPWHLLSLTLRLVAVLLAWSALQTLWPHRPRTNFIASVLFLLYPFFTLQPQAVVYAEHWISFALFVASLLLTMHAIQNPKRYLPYTALAILAETLHLFTVEYFVGLELLRPFVLWATIASEAGNPGPDQLRNPENNLPRNGFFNPGYAQTVKRVVQTWLPYLLILLLFLYWRTFILGGLGLRNNPMDALSLASLLTSLQNLPADIALVLVSSWFRLVDPAFLVLDRARNLVLLALALLSGVAAWFYSRSLADDNVPQLPPPTQPAIHNTPYGTPISYLLSGFLAFLLGLAPAYAANFILHAKLEPWNGRFALAALPGAAMILAVAFERLITSGQARRVTFAVLAGLLIGFHNRVAFDFNYSWEKQVKLYEQLTWRAPYIEPGTAIITDQEILGYMGDYPTSFAFQTIYDAKSLRPSPYWFFAMSENLDTDAASLVEGTQLKARKYASIFVADSRASLIIVFEPEKNQCLWILRPQDAEYRGLLPQIKTAAQISNLSRIHDQPQSDFTLFRSIVPERRETWCFHYQRADLARQFGDWEQVVILWESAQKGGYSPGHGFEYIPFIQAFARTGDWEEAFNLTKQSNRTSESMKTILCPTWEDLAATTPETAERTSAIGQVNDLLGCRVQ